MSGEPSNFASECLVAAAAFLSAGYPDWDIRAMLTDGFRYEDRRRGRLLGEVDADTWPRFILSFWQTGAGNPQYRVPRVLAVRGDRFAACRVDLDYGNGMTNEYVEVIGLDPTLSRLQVVIDFDADDVDGVIAELDRLEG